MLHSQLPVYRQVTTLYQSPSRRFQVPFPFPSPRHIPLFSTTHSQDIIMKFVQEAIDNVRTDHTWDKAARLTAKGARALPRGTAYYAIDKFPIIGWLPQYNPRWLINDLIAGLTIGLMLIPQGLSYAKIAGIPVENGLQASWLPPLVYTFMGSTKGKYIIPLSLWRSLTCRRLVHRPNFTDWPHDERCRPSPRAGWLYTTTDCVCRRDGHGYLRHGHWTPPAWFSA